jgi:hypothetical protein
MVLLVTVPGRADTESPALAKYRTRVGRAVQKALAFLAKRLGSDESLAREVNRLCGDYLLGLAQGDRFLFKGASHDIYMTHGRAYTIYYASNAMFQLGGTYWERFAPLLYRHVLNSQGNDGGWHNANYGRAYETAMRVLALTVTYRQLPIYQR